MNCNFCNSTNLKEILFLGNIPLGYPVDKKNINIWKGKLAINICNECFLIQNTTPIPEKLQVNELFYLSKHSRLQDLHNQEIIDFFLSNQKLKKDDLIIEIGCGDGELLNKFRNKNFKNLLGIEPSIHDKSHYTFEVIEDFFNEETSNYILENKKKPKLIFANYVLDQVPNLKEFIKNLSSIMDRKTMFFLEITQFINFFNTLRIDQFAHERTNWFTLSFIKYLLKEFNLYINDISLDKCYRGGTYRLLISRDTKENQNVYNFLNEEQTFLQKEKVDELQKRITRKKDEIKQLLNEQTNDIICYGAGVKSSTLVNWLNLQEYKVLFTIDADPNKNGLFIPLTNIQIFDLKKIDEIKTPVSILILSLDHKKEIIKLLRKTLPKNSKILISFPKIEVINVN